MIKKLTILTLFVCCAFSAFSKDTVAIAPFSGPYADDAIAISDIFGTKLSATGKFKVLTRTSIDTLLAETEFQQSGITDDDNTVKMGRFLNANYMVTGSIVKLGTANILYIQVLDIETAEIVSGSEIQFTQIEEVLDQLDGLVSTSMAKMNRYGYVEPVESEVTTPETANQIAYDLLNRNLIRTNAAKRRNRTGFFIAGGISVISYLIAYNNDATAASEAAEQDYDEYYSTGGYDSDYYAVAVLSYGVATAGAIVATVFGIKTVVYTVRAGVLQKQVNNAKLSFAPVLNPTIDGELETGVMFTYNF